MLKSVNIGMMYKKRRRKKNIKCVNWFKALK